MDKDEFQSFFVPLYRMKELFRQGWIGKVPISEIESVAEHSFGVAFLSLLFVPIENDLRQKAQTSLSLLNKLDILEKSIVHDLPESQYLDLDRSFNELLSHEEHQLFKSKLDLNSEKKLLELYNNLQKRVFSLNSHKILPEMNTQESEEDQFVKLMDVLELYFQTMTYLKKKFISEDLARPFIQTTTEKIRTFSKQFLLVEYLFKT